VEDSEGAEDKKKPLTHPRPGHADLAPATFWNGPARGRQLPGWLLGRWPKRCWASSASRCAGM
jgi:hypothetical protein